MKKIFPIILILLVVVQLFAPFSVGIKNKAEAAAETGSDISKYITYANEIGSNEITIKPTFNFDGISIIFSGYTTYYLKIKLGDKSSEAISLKDIAKDSSAGYVTFSGLKESTSYQLTITISKNVYQQTVTISTVETEEIYNKTDSISTISVDQQNKSGTVSEIRTALIEEAKEKATDGLPACNMLGLKGGTPMGCLAQGMYYILFKPTSYLFAQSGKMLDVLLMYSISDEAYRSSFVTSGWGIVRDFCNMFFIFVLLYIAIGTILDLNGFKTKEMIVHVVLIGIFINFSLFATKVIIDTSNILARVFYNQNTIAITSSGSTTNSLGDFGEIKLSEVIVSMSNPQKLIFETSAINQIPIRGTVSEDSGTTTSTESDDEKSSETTSGDIDAGTFIIAVLLTTIFNVVGMIVFVSCALMFLIRVVGLWIAMILVPFAFFSYMVPKLDDADMIGWKKWWPETLNLAFMAPIFAFFMYLIVSFTDKGLGSIKNTLSGGSEASGLSKVISILVPFLFIMVLLWQAKSITKKMSGKLGDSITKGASTIGKLAMGAGGLAAGAAMGIGAGVLRGTVGRVGSNIAKSEKWKEAGKKGGIGGLMARTMVHAGNVASTSNMDVRGLKIGGKTLGQMSIAGKNLESLGFKTGKAKETSFVGSRNKRVEKREKRMKELEVDEDSKITQDIRNAQNNLSRVKNDPDRQNKILELNNGRQDAPKDSVESKGIGALERDLSSKDKDVVDAERKVKDSVNEADVAAKDRDFAIKEKELAMSVLDKAKQQLNEVKSSLEKANTDEEKQSATELVTKAEQDIDKANDKLSMSENNLINAINKLQIANDNIVRAKDKRDNVVKARDIARTNLEERQGAIRDQEKEVHIAENELKRLENIKTGVNNNRRASYANAIQGDLYAITNFLTTLSTQSKAEREAANKILAQIKGEKIIK